MRHWLYVCTWSHPSTNHQEDLCIKSRSLGEHLHFQHPRSSFPVPCVSSLYPTNTISPAPAPVMSGTGRRPRRTFDPILCIHHIPASTTNFDYYWAYLVSNYGGGDEALFLRAIGLRPRETYTADEWRWHLTYIWCQLEAARDPNRPPCPLHAIGTVRVMDLF